MIELASLIEEFLCDGKYWIPTHEVMKLTGLTTGAAAQALVRWYGQLAEQYRRELPPSVIEVYTYARARGFFDVAMQTVFVFGSR